MTRAAASEPLLFEPHEIPETPVPVSEASPEWRDALMLRLVESVRFNPERLVTYVANEPDRIGFLDFVIERLGGRSQ